MKRLAKSTVSIALSAALIIIATVSAFAASASFSLSVYGSSDSINRYFSYTSNDCYLKVDYFAGGPVIMEVYDSGGGRVADRTVSGTETYSLPRPSISGYFTLKCTSVYSNRATDIGGTWVY